MNEKLIVENFGPIKNAELDLKKVTVFIGPQGSGKSTLAKLVAICKEEDKSFLFSKPSRIQSREHDYGLKSFKNKNTAFHYESKISNIDYSSECRISRTLLGESIKLEVVKIGGRLNLIAQEEEHFTDEYIKTIYGNYAKIIKNYNIEAPIYIPTERFLLSTISSSLFGLMNNDINLPKTLTEFGNKYLKAAIKISSDDIPISSIANSDSKVNIPKHIELFDLQFEYRSGQFFLIDTKNNYEVNLKDSASGMQSSIPLILVVNHEYNEGNKYFIVEEPELNLFPTTQKELVGYLADKCTRKGNELLMTTHSPYVLTALNNLIFAFQVAQVLPERADEIAQIIPKEQWLNPDDVAAYYVGEDGNGEKGGIHSIFNKKTGLIGQNELDEVSDELGDEFTALMNIYRTRKRETVN